MKRTHWLMIVILILLSAAFANQLASKPATAQGITYALSGKAAKSATATPAASLLAQFSQQGPKLVGTGAAGKAPLSLSAESNTAIGAWRPL